MKYILFVEKENEDSKEKRLTYYWHMQDFEETLFLMSEERWDKVVGYRQ